MSPHLHINLFLHLLRAQTVHASHFILISFVTEIYNSLETFGDEDNNNEPGNHGNGTFNSTRFHDNTTDSYSDNVTTLNDTLLLLNYEATTEKLDEHDLIIVNGNIPKTQSHSKNWPYFSQIIHFHQWTSILIF